MSYKQLSSHFRKALVSSYTKKICLGKFSLLNIILYTCIHISEGVKIPKHDKSSFHSDVAHTEVNENTNKGSSLAWKLLRRNFVSPEEKIIYQVLEGFKESKPYVLNPKYSTPTSLPLYFYFGYQLLQELELIEESGPVCFWLYI